MRKYLYAAPLAAAALVLATPAAQAHTATPRTTVHVLTISKLRGKAVKPGAKLVASLAKGTSVTISLGSQKVTCKSSSFTLKVIKNPARPGKAKLSATSQTLSRCSINISGGTVSHIAALNLPYNVTVSDAKGDPVKVSGTSASRPVEFTATVTVSSITVTCNYSAPSSAGHASNTTHLTTFKNQKFSEAAGSNTLFCEKGPALFSAKFGPIKDASVSGKPTVYVN